MTMLTPKQVKAIGFASVGTNVQISDRASFYGASRIEIGNDVRIDDFCVLSAGKGGISIGRNVHVAVYSCLIGAGRIVVSDFANISSRVSIYSSNDDYSGEWMTNPTVPSEYTNVSHAPVLVGSHAIVGSGCVVLPGVTIGDGAAIGSLSMVRVDCEPFTLYGGVPAKRIKERKRDLLDVADDFLAGRSCRGKNVI
jgi:dTDP-4-amino-4,6-dideoxy-D-glucose acyltransferase